jgi:tRNA pseudouridine55 synthase
MLLLIDKPQGITSHDVVNFVRRISHEKRVGHAGTLDPNASGLLLVAVGRETTKTLGQLTRDTDKEYEAEVFLGEGRDTDDIEGDVIATSSKVPSSEAVRQALAGFEGLISQVPPFYSAIKLQGKKAYELSRKNVDFSLSARDVTIYSISDVSYLYPYLRFRVVVSAGTYIRSLARDLGRKLGCYGYLSQLRRTRIGEYHVSDALTLPQLEKRFEQENNSRSKD